ncbi:membrane associated phosphodiesterase [Streptomyces avidinii]
MYRAKAGGKGRVELYKPQMQQDVVRKAELATRLRAALHDGEFALLHQPVVCLADGRITSVGAQRAGGPRRACCSRAPSSCGSETARADPPPPESETAELGRWLLQEAVEQAAERTGDRARRARRRADGARRLLDRSMPLGSVEALLTRHGLPSGRSCIELADPTPRVALDDLERRLTALHRLGVGYPLDGFGSGYAAISALRRLPVDMLKLDRGLVEGVVESARLHKITAGLLRIANDLGCGRSPTGWTCPSRSWRCARWGAHTAREWPFPDRSTSTGCAVRWCAVRSRTGWSGPTSTGRRLPRGFDGDA